VESYFNLMFFRFLCEAGLGDCTAEAQRAPRGEFLSNKSSELCKLGASVVKKRLLLWEERQ